MSDIEQSLRESTSRLAEKGIDDPARQAASLLALAIKRDRTFLIAHPEYELTRGEEKLFSEYVARRAGREPLQYIRGTQEFYGLEFEVSPGVLIPRPETELLVENAIELLKDQTGPFFCEAGTGSGCISVSILDQAPQAFAVGLDISGEALGVSERNARKHNVFDRIKLLRSDLFAGLGGEKFDLIVSNPPYIPKYDYEHLQPEVRDFEPASALTDGGDGLSIIRRIVGDTPDHLRPGGFLLMEIGFGQAESVRSMFDPNIWRDVEIIPDLQSIPRVVKARTG
jgi:release factor glutamine methyltransferase